MKSRKLKKNYASIPELIRDVETVVNSEPTFTVTLSTGTVSSVVSCPLSGKDSFIGMMPTNTAAASEPWAVTTRDTGSFTVEHSSGSSVRTFVYFVWG